jgi:hypothetical protein
MNQMQLNNFSHLVGIGVPDEWAYLIAERSTVELGEDKLASEALLGAFVFGGSDEGMDFWLSVLKAIKSEEEAK